MDIVYQNQPVSVTKANVHQTYVPAANSRTAGSIPSYESFVRQSVAPNALRSVDDTQISQLSTTKYQDDDRFSFFDFLDIINPLQHIPVLNLAYRKLTGDEIKPSSMVFGSALYGGPVGAASGVINAVAIDATGKDVLENVASLVGLSSKEEPPAFSYTPEKDISAEAIAAYEDLPVSLLAFAQTPLPTVKS